MTEQRLTKHQAAVIGAFTGILCGPFSDVHEYAERKLGHPIFTSEFTTPRISNKLKEKASADFLAIRHQGDES